MLDVFYTVDVEVWCKTWDALDAEFPDAYRRYILGHTARGDFGLPMQVRLLRDHGLQGVFFVEPLFALRFGSSPLRDIVSPLREGGQDVQLHLHTEWLDEAPQRLLADSARKRQFLHGFSLDEQCAVIGEGRRLLRDAGAPEPCAFRAGNFGFNADTLVALDRLGIGFDSSYNACHGGLDSGLAHGTTVVEPLRAHGVFEYPVTVFVDGLGKLRPMQLTACSWAEMEGVLWRALEAGRRSVVIVSHSFELLDASRERADAAVVRRFRSMCAFLDRHRDRFRTRGFADLTGSEVPAQPQPLTSPAWHTAGRLAEQAVRRLRSGSFRRGGREAIV